MGDETESEDAGETQKAKMVADKLGRISLSEWLSFVKKAGPPLVVLLPALLLPVDTYLDKREAELKDALLKELGTVDDATIREEIAALRDELKALESEIKGELRSSPNAQQNMEKLAEVRERLARVEALAGIGHPPRR